MYQTVPLDCQACRRPFSIEISDVVDLGSEPLLRGRLLRGSLNFALCPHCGDRGPIDHAFLVLDPVAERSILFVPEGIEGSDISAAILRNVLSIYPTAGPRSFLENQVQVGDWSQLMALLAEGAAK